MITNKMNNMNKKKKKNKKNYYFTQIHEDAIVEYAKDETTRDRREILYKELENKMQHTEVSM